MKHTSYNSLHTVEVANVLFTHREHILTELASVLEEYGGGKFGVCLVHRHCVLEEGEVMVAEGNISQPVSGALNIYPERWLSTGEAYEFTREKTTSPSETLLEIFRRVVRDVQILGLFYISGDDDRGVALETTNGRRNIVEFVPYDTPRSSIPTGWRPKALKDGKYSSAVVMQECSSCRVENATHITNANKMEQLLRRGDLGNLIV